MDNRNFDDLNLMGFIREEAEILSLFRDLSEEDKHKALEKIYECAFGEKRTAKEILGE